MVGASHIEHSPEYLAQTARDFARSARLFRKADGFRARIRDRQRLYSVSREELAAIRTLGRRQQPPSRPTHVLVSRKSGQSARLDRSSASIAGSASTIHSPGSLAKSVLQMDVHGHLTALEAVPPHKDDSPPAKEPMVWDSLFDAAGLDQSKFTPAEPQWQPARRMGRPRRLEGNRSRNPWS